METLINLTKVSSPEQTLGATHLFNIGGLSVTNSMTSGVMVTILIFLVIIILRKNINLKGVPGKFQIVIEMLVEWVYNLVEQITGSKEIARKILPIIVTIFMYIAISNVILLLIPGIAAITYDGASIEGLPHILKTGGEVLFRPHTNDYSTTLALAVSVILWTHLYGIYEHGIFKYLDNKFFRISLVIKGFKQGVMPGLMSLIEVFLGLLEIISEFAKTLSLSIRLFGNMFAGELLTSVIMSLFALVMPVPLVFMGLFTGFLQALVFGALASAYFGLAIKEE